MEFTLSNLTKTDIFSGIFHQIKTFSENISIQFDNDGLYVQTMDHTRVAIMEIRLPKEWFDTYTIENGVPIVIGVNCGILFKILNARDKGQTVKMAYDSGATDTLSVYFSSEGKGTFDKSFEVPLIDLEIEFMQIPAIEYQAEFSLPAGTFAAIVNQLKMFGETMDITCSEERIALNAYSQDSGKMSVEIGVDDLTEFSINEGEEIDMSFSLNYLHNICLYNRLSKEIQVKICDQYPLFIRYSLDEHFENAEIQFYLAPKIQDD